MLSRHAVGRSFWSFWMEHTWDGCRKCHMLARLAVARVRQVVEFCCFGTFVPFCSLLFPFVPFCSENPCHDHPGPMFYCLTTKLQETFARTPQVKRTGAAGRMSSVGISACATCARRHAVGTSLEVLQLEVPLFLFLACGAVQICHAATVSTTADIYRISIINADILSDGDIMASTCK